MTHPETLFEMVTFMRTRGHIKSFNLNCDSENDGEWSVFVHTNTEVNVVEYGMSLENVCIRSIISLEEYLMKNAETDYVIWRGIRDYDAEKDI